MIDFFKNSFRFHKQASDDEDNEIEIVEPQTDTITLDSDNEEDDAPNKKPPTLPIITTITATSNAHTVVRQASTEGGIQHSQLGNELLIAPKSTTHTNASTTNLASVGNARGITVNKPNDKMEEVDMMTAARTFLVSLLEVDSDAADGGSDSSQQKPKQPRKKTTNKPNPTLLKQKEMLERERLEEMKRNDQKLKMKCAISLKKAEEEFPFAKDMLVKHESISKTDAKAAAAKESDEKMETDTEKAENKKEKAISSEITKDINKHNDSGEVEILTVELESSADDGKETGKSEAEDNSKQFTIVMGGDDDDDDDEDDDNNSNKGKSLIIEVEGNTSNEKESPLKVVIDAKDVDESTDKVAVTSASEKPNKEKAETVSECAKRVIESVKASDKKAEMEKKEQQAINVTTKAASPPPTTTTTTTNNDNIDNGDNAAAAADDTIEPIMIEDTDMADSIESPTKISPQPICGDVEKEAAAVSSSIINNEITTTTENSTANEENKSDAAAASAEDKAKKELLETCNDVENKNSSTTAVVAAAEPSSAVELNEPEIDVEKEIEKLLSKVPEETTADNGTNDTKTLETENEIKIIPTENIAPENAETPETATATTTSASTTTTADVVPELLTELVSDLLESESAATLT